MGCAAVPVRSDRAAGVLPVRGAQLALVAALGFALEPTLLLAQVEVVDPDQPVKVQAKPKPKKAYHRQSPTDNVSDDLNRREA
ncbi:MAG: hypothetical protein RL385_2812, partial [Pseudomonadota bacterium]